MNNPFKNGKIPQMSAETSNLCKEAGCHAACCEGSCFSFSYPVKKVLEWFPNAIKVGQYGLAEQRARGVYYEVGFFGSARVRIVGNCPNLGPVDNCQIYKKRPSDCEKLAIGSKECSGFRREQERHIRVSQVVNIQQP